MKKILLVILVVILTTFGFAENSPTVTGLLIQTNPEIPFEIVNNPEPDIALNILYDLFGTRLIKQFQVFEVIDLNIQKEWEVVEFKFIEDFTENDTVIAIFNNDEQFVILFLEYEEGIFPIDFRLIPPGFNRMYIVSDFQPELA